MIYNYLLLPALRATKVDEFNPERNKSKKNTAVIKSRICSMSLLGPVPSLSKIGST